MNAEDRRDQANAETRHRHKPAVRSRNNHAVGNFKEYEWEKPSWCAQPHLRATGKGEIVKKRGDLQNPITHVKKDEMDAINFEANPNLLRPTESGCAVRLGETLAGPITLINGAPSEDHKEMDGDDGEIYGWEKPEWVVKTELRTTEKGAAARTKGDLQNPITHVIKTNIDDINYEANPLLLRPTKQGCAVRTGGDITLPITHIGRLVAEKTDCSSAERGASATHDDEPAHPQTTMECPEPLESEGNTQNETIQQQDSAYDTSHTIEVPRVDLAAAAECADTAKSGHCTESPVKEPSRCVASTSGATAPAGFEWEKPSWTQTKLRSTNNGELVKKKGDLQNPITHVVKSNIDDINYEANPTLLRPTDKGKIVKKKGDLQSPITHVVKTNIDDINYEANPLLLRPTKEGSAVRTGEDITLPITHISRVVTPKDVSS